jgi:hypothetical protein
MYAQTDTIAPSSWSSATTMTTSRAILQTRPAIQRALIRSWEYTRAGRITVLAIRLLVAMWLVVLGTVALSASSVWGWAVLAAAAGVFAFGIWVFRTAAKGWPASQA